MRRLVLVLSVCFLGNLTASAADITWVSFHETDAPSPAAAEAGLTAAADIGYTDLLSSNGHNVTRFLTHEPLTAPRDRSVERIRSGHHRPIGKQWALRSTD